MLLVSPTTAVAAVLRASPSLLRGPPRVSRSSSSSAAAAMISGSSSSFSEPMRVVALGERHRCRRAYSSVDAPSRAERVGRVLSAKSESGLTYDDLAAKLGVTNTYCAQLLLGQARLTPETASKLTEALPTIARSDVDAMVKDFPMRSFDDDILKEPHVYRTNEALMHYGEAIKSIINEQCGDGIMSAIDFYCDVGTTTGKHGERRVVITLNGKFLPFIEQRAEDNGATSPRD